MPFHEFFSEIVLVLTVVNTCEREAGTEKHEDCNDAQLLEKADVLHSKSCVLSYLSDLSEYETRAS